MRAWVVRHLTIKVHAAAVNFFDSLQLAGPYQIKSDLPFIPGAEVVAQVGLVQTGYTERPSVLVISARQQRWIEADLRIELGPPRDLQPRGFTVGCRPLPTKIRGALDLQGEQK